MSESLIIRTLCFPLLAVVGFFLTFNNCSCKTHELGYLFHNLPVHTCTPGSGEVDNTAFKPNGHPTSSHPCHCYPSLDRGRQYIRGRIPAFSLLTFTTQHDDEAGKIGYIPLGWSGPGSMIQRNSDQIKGTNKSTLIGHSLVSLMQHDLNGLGTIPVWLHSLFGMIWIRSNDLRSLGSNQRIQWIHSGSFVFFDVPWSKWFWHHSIFAAFPWRDPNDQWSRILGSWWINKRTVNPSTLGHSVSFMRNDPGGLGPSILIRIIPEERTFRVPHVGCHAWGREGPS